MELSARKPTNHANGGSSPEDPQPAEVSRFAETKWPAAVMGLKLSPREIEIVQCMLSFKENEIAIAQHLRISPHTVHTHLERLYRKLGVNSRCQVIARIFLAYLRATRETSTSAGFVSRPDDRHLSS